MMSRLAPVLLFGLSACAGATKEVVVYPGSYDKAFANPLKGFRPDVGGKHPYATLFRQYIPWKVIENDESDGIERIAAYCDDAWKDLPRRNGKVIPRVYLDWPGKPGNSVCLTRRRDSRFGKVCSVTLICETGCPVIVGTA